MKRVFSLVCCGILVLSGALFGAKAYMNEAVSSSKLVDAMIYYDFEEPFADPEIALRENFGDELADEIINAGPDGLIMFDLVGGGVEVVHCSSEYSVAESTEAFIPEGLDVVEPLTA